MRHAVPVAKTTRTTWRTDAREIAEALGIPLTPYQWIAIESAEDDGSSLPLSGMIDVVRWEPHQPASYQSELDGTREKAADGG